jgi:hypothetical protein
MTTAVSARPIGPSDMIRWHTRPPPAWYAEPSGPEAPLELTALAGPSDAVLKAPNVPRWFKDRCLTGDSLLARVINYDVPLPGREQARETRAECKAFIESSMTAEQLELLLDRLWKKGCSWAKTALVPPGPATEGRAKALGPDIHGHSARAWAIDPVSATGRFFLSDIHNDQLLPPPMGGPFGVDPRAFGLQPVIEELGTREVPAGTVLEYRWACCYNLHDHPGCWCGKAGVLTGELPWEGNATQDFGEGKCTRPPVASSGKASVAPAVPQSKPASTPRVARSDPVVPPSDRLTREQCRDRVRTALDEYLHETTSSGSEYPVVQFNRLYKKLFSQKGMFDGTACLFTTDKVFNGLELFSKNIRAETLRQEYFIHYSTLWATVMRLPLDEKNELETSTSKSRFFEGLDKIMILLRKCLITYTFVEKFIIKQTAANVKVMVGVVSTIATMVLDDIVELVLEWLRYGEPKEIMLYRNPLVMETYQKALRDADLVHRDSNGKMMAYKFVYQSGEGAIQNNGDTITIRDGMQGIGVLIAYVSRVQDFYAYTLLSLSNLY